MWTCDGPPRLKLDFGLFRIESMRRFNEASNGIELNFAIGIHKAEVSDFHESGWQDMLEKTADELQHIQSHGSPSLASRFFVAKGRGSILHFHNAAIRDSHLEDMGRQVLEARRAFAHRPAVDVPLRFPDLGRDLVEEPCSLHFISKLGSEDFGQGLHRHMEVDSRRMPGAIFGRKSSSGGNAMDMGTILEGTPPCMEDPEETGKIAPDVFPVVVEFFYGLGGRFEKGRTGDPLVAPDEPAQTLGNSEGDHEMMAGKPAVHPGFKPLPGFRVPAGGAVTIAARSVNGMLVPALLAFQVGDAGLFGSTLHDSRDGFSMFLGHVLTEAGYVLGTEGAEDLGYPCRN